MTAEDASDTTPTLAVGLIGAAGSGMTSFVLAAAASAADSAALSLRSESVEDQDRSDAAWNRLLRGTFPPPSWRTGPREHTLLLSGRGTAQARITVVDQRGNVLEDGAHSPDFALLHDTLVHADAIFVAVDGRVLGELSAGRPDPGTRGNLVHAKERLGVYDISMALRPAVDERFRDVRTDLLLVVLITKYDVFRAATAELADADALQVGTERLRRLMPVLFETGVTALCPVQVGWASRAADGAPGQRGVLAPFALAAGYALSRSLRDRSADLVARIGRLGQLDRELATGGGRSARTATMTASRADLSTALVREQRAFDGVRALLAKSRFELRDVLLYQVDRRVSINRDFVIG